MGKEVIIEVRGGLVQQVYSNDSSIKVKILDWDNCDDETVRYNDNLQKQTKDMSIVY